MVHDFMALLGNPVFWIFGGGTIVVLAGLITDAMTKSQKLRAQERERERERERESHRALLGLTESDDIAGLKLRIEALEQDVARLEGLLQGSAPRRVAAPAKVPEELAHREQVSDA